MLSNNNNNNSFMYLMMCRWENVICKLLSNESHCAFPCPFFLNIFSFSVRPMGSSAYFYCLFRLTMASRWRCRCCRCFLWPVRESALHCSLGGGRLVCLGFLQKRMQQRTVWPNKTHGRHGRDTQRGPQMRTTNAKMDMNRL